MTTLFFVTVATAIYYNINENVLKHYTTATPVLENIKLFMINIPKDSRRVSTSHQLIKYYKSNQDNIIPVKMDNVEKNTGTLSLLSISYEQSNNTYDSKQKNIILKKLDTINKKLRKTFKQLQATTSKTFINFNFNHTQLIEDFYSSHQSNNVLNSKYIKSSYVNKQKDSNYKNSSIPKLCLDYLKYFQKNKVDIELDTNKLQNPELEKLVSNREVKIMDNENKYNIAPKKKSSLITESKIINTPTQSHYSLLTNFPITKSDMKLNDNNNVKNRNEKETILEKNTIEKENNHMNEFIANNDNEKIKINDNNFDVNKTESKKNDSNLLNNTKHLENNIFASPGGFALLLFILYAIFMF